MREGADHPDLVVVQHRDADAGGAPGRAVPAFGAHHQPGADRLAGREPHRRALRGPLHREPPRPARRRAGWAAIGSRAFSATRSDARLHQEAEGLRPDILGPEMQRERRGRLARPAVGHADVEDRAGRLGQPLPDPRRLQQALGGERDGVGAAVEIRAAPWAAGAGGPPPRRAGRPRRGWRRGWRRPGRRRGCRRRPRWCRSCAPHATAQAPGPSARIVAPLCTGFGQSVSAAPQSPGRPAAGSGSGTDLGTLPVWMRRGGVPAHEVGDGTDQALQARRGARSAHPARRAGADGDRGEGLRPPEGADGDLPRRRVPGELPAEDQDRGGGARRAGGWRRRGHRQGRAHRQDRRRQGVRAGRGERAAHPHRRNRRRRRSEPRGATTTGRTGEE